MPHPATTCAWPGGPEFSSSAGGPDVAADTGAVVIGRQSVRNRDSAVIGYAVLTTVGRSPACSAAAEQDGYDGPGEDSESDRAERLSASACTSGDGRIDLMVGDGKVFHRADREVLSDRPAITLPPPRLVLEIDEELGSDPAAVTACQALSEEGFGIALAEFPWTDPDPRLLDLAAVIKIDTRGRTAEQLGELRERYRGPGRQLLADNVETPAELAIMRELGFDLFQGYALAHVPAGPHRDLGASQAGLARVSALLSHPRDFDEIEDVLRTEPGLAYQIMELASVGRMGETARRVASLRRALVLIGSWRIQTWMAMLLAHPHGQRTNGAMTGALARARACELLARPLGRAEASLGYTGGMISAFEELAQVPRYELEHTLALSDELRDAAFGEETDIGRLVSDVADRQDGRENPRRLSDRPVEEIEAALAAGYGWAARASAAIA